MKDYLIPSITRNINVDIKTPDLDGRTIQFFIAHLFIRKKFRSSGRIYKYTLRDFIQQYNLNVPDLNWLFYAMKQRMLVLHITGYSVQFLPYFFSCTTLRQVHKFVLEQSARSTHSSPIDFLSIPRLLDAVENPSWDAGIFPILCEWGQYVIDDLSNRLESATKNDPSFSTSLRAIRYQELLVAIESRMKFPIDRNLTILL